MLLQMFPGPVRQAHGPLASALPHGVPPRRPPAIPFPPSAATLAPLHSTRILPARKNDPVFQQQVHIKHRFKFF